MHRDYFRDKNVSSLSIVKDTDNQYKNSFYCNHLGNILSTISDRKIAASTSGTGTLEHFEIAYTSFIDYYPFGMMIKERSWSSSSYRFGFNGMEEDPEIVGEGNSLDFGARIYSPRLGRWFSPDPLEKKYPNISLYNFASNMPIITVDKDGRDNVIYLLYLPNSENKLKLSDAKAMAEQANENFKNLGLQTTVIVKDMGEMETFESSYTDATDAIAILGTKSDVINYVKTQDKSFARELTDKNDPWIGGAENPERSDNYASKGKFIAIDANGVGGFGKKAGINDLKKTGALIVNHGAGHNAGIGHTYTDGIMMGASSLKKELTQDGGTYEDVVGNGENSFGVKRNQEFIDKVKVRFGTNTSSDNYEKNANPFRVRFEDDPKEPKDNLGGGGDGSDAIGRH